MDGRRFSDAVRIDRAQAIVAGRQLARKRVLDV
jgi:hypothetical protein